MNLEALVRMKLTSFLVDHWMRGIGRKASRRGVFGSLPNMLLTPRLGQKHGTHRGDCVKAGHSPVQLSGCVEYSVICYEIGAGSILRRSLSGVLKG